MAKRIFTIGSFILFTISSIFAQTHALKTQIEKVLENKNAEVGVTIFGSKEKDMISINGDKHFPMQSVFKFHIALAVLNEVDRGNLSLEQDVYIKKEELLPNTWSPIRQKYPEGNIYLKLSEILKYTVSESDNNGCDILLRLIGGPQAVNDYMHQIGINDVSIQASEEEMHKNWDVQFTNWTTPVAATKLLVDFYDRKILSAESYSFLWKIMSETTTGGKRIKGQLPAETIVAHKTGSSGTNSEGITAAINDIGIVILPDKSHFAISIFITNSTENSQTNEKIISDISKLAWEHYSIVN